MEKRTHTRANSKRNLIWIAVLGFCVVPLFILSAGAQETIKFTRGDVDGNGETELADLFLASEYFQGNARLPVIEAIDVINDGRITLGDLYALAHVISTPGPRGFDPERAQITRGDLNGDGQVSERDAGRLEAFLKGGERLDAVALDAADVNRDGRIDRRDQVALDDELLQDGDDDQPDPHKVSDATAQAPKGDGPGETDPDRRPRRSDPDVAYGPGSPSVIPVPFQTAPGAENDFTSGQ